MALNPYDELGEWKDYELVTKKNLWADSENKPSVHHWEFWGSEAMETRFPGAVRTSKPSSGGWSWWGWPNLTSFPYKNCNEIPEDEINRKVWRRKKAPPEIKITIKLPSVPTDEAAAMAKFFATRPGEWPGFSPSEGVRK